MGVHKNCVHKTTQEHINSYSDAAFHSVWVLSHYKAGREMFTKC